MLPLDAHLQQRSHLSLARLEHQRMSYNAWVVGGQGRWWSAMRTWLRFSHGSLESKKPNQIGWAKCMILWLANGDSSENWRVEFFVL